jgi:photosystem II stability/assembly factor-like uncharacterized protein
VPELTKASGVRHLTLCGLIEKENQMKTRTILAMGVLLISVLSQQASQAQQLNGPWTFLGPQPISKNNGVPLGDGYVGPMPIGGRVSSVAVADSNTVYIGTSGGGVWKTTDGGQNWIPKTDLQPSLTIGALALDPTNKNIIYAGTGEYIPYYDVFDGVGILRSSDAGETWSLLPDPTGVFKGTRIARIAVDPANSKTIYAATNFGLALSNDSGQSWKSIKKETSSCSSFTDVVVDSSTTPSTVYAAISDGAGRYVESGCQGIWKASTSDNNFKLANGTKIFKEGPVSQTPTPGKKPDIPNGNMIRLAIDNYQDLSRTSHTVLYVAMQVYLGQGKYDLRAFRSVNGGDSWSSLPATVHSDWSCYGIAVQTKFDGSRRKFITAIYVLSDELFVSLDEGQSWENITSAPVNLWESRTAHHDMHGFGFVPGHSAGFFLGTDGGIYKSDNYGRSYINLNDTLGNIHFYRGAVSNDLNPVVIGSMHDSGFVISTGVNEEWMRVQGSDGGSVVWDPQDTKRLYLTRAGDPLGVNRSTDGGQTFQAANSGISPTDPKYVDFLAPLALDPKNPKHLYVASNLLYTSMNGADTWKIAGPPRGFPNSNYPITSIGLASDLTTASVYVSRAQRVFKYVQKLSFLIPTKQDEWSDVTFNLSPSNIYSVTALAVDPANPGTVYAGLSAPSGQSHLMKLVGGNNWVDASHNLPDANVNSIVINPNSPNDIFIATDEGVYRSTNGGDYWFSVGYGMPKAIAWDVVLNSSGATLYAFTHGRGVWKANVKDLPTKPVRSLGIKYPIAMPTRHVDMSRAPIRNPQ